MRWASTIWLAAIMGSAMAQQAETLAERKVRLQAFTAAILKACPQESYPDFADCREGALERILPRDMPEGDKATVAVAAVEQALARSDAAEQRQAARVRQRCAKAGIKEGAVRLGMSKEMVIECGWGKPESVNRTISAGSVTEQWVYGDGTYLYFQNGRLRTIQD